MLARTVPRGLAGSSNGPTTGDPRWFRTLDRGLDDRRRLGSLAGQSWSGEHCCVAVEVDRPSLVDTGADALPARAMPLEVAVLELDACAVSRFGDESDLDFAGVVGVRLELPGGPDVPAEDHAGRRFIDEDPRPVALRAVLGSVVDVTTDLGLEHGLGDRGAHQVVLTWLEVPEPVGEHAECLVDWHVYDERFVDRGVGGRCHCLSSGVESMAFW